MHPLADPACLTCQGTGCAVEWSPDDGPDDEPGKVPCECVIKRLEQGGIAACAGRE